MPRALVVEDDGSVLSILTDLAEERGFSTCAARSLKDAREGIRGEPLDLAMLDVVLPDGSALDLLMEISGPRAPHVILMSGHSEVDQALRHLPLKSIEYLKKPIDLERLRKLLDDYRRRIAEIQKEIEEDVGAIVAESDQMRQVFKMIDRVAPTDATVLISGESGTGKEVVARAIHDRSYRRKGPFVAVNCGAIPENLIDSELFGHEEGAFTGAVKKKDGLVSRAAGGTLFLDEIGEMPPAQQVRLLRMLEIGTFRRVGGTVDIEADCRVLAATNRDPQAAVEEGKIREDLYYRLAVFPIHIPPLRERVKDVRRLADHFLAQFNRSQKTQKQWTEEAMALLESYHWPGNVRQLKHTVNRACILSAGDEVTAENLPEMLRTNAAEIRTPGLEPGTPIAEVERELILMTLRHFGGNKTKAAKALGISLRTLYNRLQAYGQDDVPGGGSVDEACPPAGAGEEE